LGAGLWWRRRSAREFSLPPEAPPTLDDAAELRIPTRRERYLASLELDVFDDAPPPSGEQVDSAVFDDDPFGLDGGPLSEAPMSEAPMSEAPMSAAPTSIDDAPLSEGPLTERRVTARPHVAPPPLQCADDNEAVDAESLGDFFLMRAIDSRQ
jgi:hypothetical protein